MAVVVKAIYKPSLKRYLNLFKFYKLPNNPLIYIFIVKNGIKDATRMLHIGIYPFWRFLKHGVLYIRITWKIAVY